MIKDDSVRGSRAKGLLYGYAFFSRKGRKAPLLQNVLSKGVSEADFTETAFKHPLLYLHFGNRPLIQLTCEAS